MTNQKQDPGRGALFTNLRKFSGLANADGLSEEEVDKLNKSPDFTGHMILPQGTELTDDAFYTTPSGGVVKVPKGSKLESYQGIELVAYIKEVDVEDVPDKVTLLKLKSSRMWAQEKKEQ